MWKIVRTGASGCGLCALWKLRNIGVTHLKVVGRGNHTESMLRDIRQLKKAFAILDTVERESEFQKQIQERLFPNGCSGNCYYRQP